MIIDCISDLHGHFPELPGGDLLILAGDYTARDRVPEWDAFYKWLDSQNYRKKVYIGGNHDNFLTQCCSKENPMHSHLKSLNEYDAEEPVYLCDSGTEFEGLTIWGSPWTKTFPGMNPHCMAFTCETEEELAEKWACIPEDVDILVTHGAPWTILDKTTRGEQVGSTSLLFEHLKRLKPKLWIFGHVHEAYGINGPYQWNNTKYVNASHVNEHYQPVNKPIRIEL